MLVAMLVATMLVAALCGTDPRFHTIPTWHTSMQSMLFRGDLPLSSVLGTNKIVEVLFGLGLSYF